MRKTEFVSGLKRIVEVLRARDLIDRITPMLSLRINQPIPVEAKTSFADLIFTSQSGFQLLTTEENTSDILKSLSLSRLYSSENLGELITLYRNATGSSQIATVAPSFAIFSRFYEFFQWLVTFEEASSSLLNWEQVDPILVTDKVLELELFDFDGSGIEITNMKNVFAALEDLRLQISRILKLPESQLKISYIESGSNITLDVKGLSDLIDSISKFILQAFTLIENRRFNRLDRRNASFAGELDLIDKVHAMQAAGSLTAEQAELFKHKLLNDAQTIFESGAMLRTVPVVEPLSTMTILSEQRETKLLGDGKP